MDCFGNPSLFSQRNCHLLTPEIWRYIILVFCFDIPSDIPYHQKNRMGNHPKAPAMLYLQTAHMLCLQPSLVVLNLAIGIALTNKLFFSK